MDRRKKILVFGYFGYVTNQLDGQTVKTREIYDLIKFHNEYDVRYADTQEFRKNIKSIYHFLKNICSCNTLIWMPAHNNIKLFAPIIYILSRLFRFKIVTITIGGWLNEFLKNLPIHHRIYKTFNGILVENKLMQQELSLSFDKNFIDVIPNFRKSCNKPSPREPDGKLKLVFMARINRKKGLDEIASLCDYLSANGYSKKISIDFYGPINPSDKKFFQTKIIEKYTFTNYHGEIQPEKINTSLVCYDVMLLPTRYFTEGFPGSVLDAFQAGLPIIATRWKYATEFIKDGHSGIIIDFFNPIDELISAVINLYQNPSFLSEMKKNAYIESLKYSQEASWKILSKYI